MFAGIRRSQLQAQSLCHVRLTASLRFGMALATRLESNNCPGRLAVNLVIWIPIVAFLGLATLGLMFAFVVACDKV